MAATGGEDPAGGVVQSHLSRAYGAAGDVDKAIETIESALSGFEKQSARAAKAGQPSQEPPGVAEARSRLKRLESATASTS